VSAARFGVIVPVFNEPRLALLLKRFDFQATPLVIVVDDGSTDGSIAAAASYPVTVLRHPARSGVGAAIRTGLEHLKKNGAELAVVMAGNNKDDPREIPALLAEIDAGAGADYVQGSRYLEADTSAHTPLKRRVITRAVAVLWSIRFLRGLTDVTNGFRAYRLAILDDARVDVSQRWLDRYELEYYIHYKVLSLGYRYREVSVSKVYPTDGQSTSKIQLARDYWSLLRPLFLLTLGLRK
jgi:dolichol-phosphate mannosyltransferase